MASKTTVFAVATLLAAGAGVAVYIAKKKAEEESKEGEEKKE